MSLNVMPTYNIVISEAQRKLIAELLDDNSKAVLRHADSYDAQDLEFENLLGLAECFHRLPSDEKEHPGVLHGVCL